MKFLFALLTFVLLGVQSIAQIDAQLIELYTRTNADPLVLPQGNDGAWLAHFSPNWSVLSKFQGRVALINSKGELVEEFNLASEEYPALKEHRTLWVMPDGMNLSLLTVLIDKSSKTLDYYHWSLTPKGELSASKMVWSVPHDFGKKIFSFKSHNKQCSPSDDYSKVLVVSPNTTDYLVLESNGTVVTEGHFDANKGMGILRGTVNNDGVPAFLFAARESGAFNFKASLAFGYQTDLNSELQVVGASSPTGYFNFDWSYLENKPNGNPVLVIFGTNVNGVLKGFNYTEVDLASNEVIVKTINDKKKALPYDMNDAQLYFSKEGNMVICSDARASIELVTLNSDDNLECCQLVTDPFKEKEMHYAYYIMTDEGPLGLALCDESGLEDIKAENGKRHGFSKKASLKLAVVSKSGCAAGTVETSNTSLTGYAFPKEDIWKRKRTYFVNGMYFVPLEKDGDPYFVTWRR